MYRTGLKFTTASIAALHEECAVTEIERSHKRFMEHDSEFSRYVLVSACDKLQQIVAENTARGF